MKYELDNWVTSRLAEPFSVEELSWTPAFGGGGVYPYLSARVVAKRLDEVVGAANWSDRYEETQVVETLTRDLTDMEAMLKAGFALENKANNTIYFPKGNDWRKTLEYQDISYGGTRCDLTILGVTKSDVGSPSYAEQLKGSYSDALKRAAVKFGVGEYLYKLGSLPGKVTYGKIDKIPTLPTWALPKGKRSPDKAIQDIIEQALQLEGGLPEEIFEKVTEAVGEVTVMGQYFSGAPLVAKRYVYETLSPIVNKYKDKGAAVDES